MYEEMEHILYCISEYTGHPYLKIKNDKSREMNYPRQLFVLFAANLPDVSLANVGAFLNNVSRTNIYHKKKKIEVYEKIDPSVKRDINAIWVLMHRPCEFTIIREVLKKTPVDKMEQLAQIIKEFHKEHGIVLRKSDLPSAKNKVVSDSCSTI